MMHNSVPISTNTLFQCNVLDTSIRPHCSPLFVKVEIKLLKYEHKGRQAKKSLKWGDMLKRGKDHNKKRKWVG